MTDLQKATAKAIVNIFESGKIRGNYGAIAVLKGDKGHLSYGRSQTTLGSGGLYTLLDRYCQAPGAKFAENLRPSLPRFKVKDLTLDNDSAVKQVLKDAGLDPVMQATQDQFFAENYFIPACRAAAAHGVETALGQAVVYDSHIQGGWGVVRPMVPSIESAGGEAKWINLYVDARRKWLMSCATPLPATVYRMETFGNLISASNWELTLPIVVHGITLREELLLEDAHPEAHVRRTLNLVDPWMRGDDVDALQAKLKNAGFDVKPDGVYGPFTDVLVKRFQTSKGIAETGVGPLTAAALGL